jgi:4-diphosphocytidyl-2-C-methyl-D-erythritol kinase
VSTSASSSIDGNERCRAGGVSAGPPALVVSAPAKLNYFLHVTGRRDDGYHTLETLMVLVDLADELTLTVRDDGAVVRAHDVDGVALDDDLALRAARALQAAARVKRGVTIALDKRIPIGGGLGGGSSDAASVLLGLNRLWSLRWSRAALAEIAVTLGADVAFFVGGDNAIARGIGERLSPISVPPAWIVIARPDAHASTAAMFAARELTRNSPSAKIDVFSEGYGRNDLEPVVRARLPAVADAIDALRKLEHGARLTGSGACAFAAFAREAEARAALAKLPRGLRGVLARTLARHPLASFA